MSRKQTIANDSTVYHPIHGLGIVNEKKNYSCIVKFISSKKSIEVYEREVKIVPYKKGEFVYVNRAIHKINDIIVEHGDRIQYSITQIDDVCKNIIKINIHDKSILPLAKDLQIKMKKAKYVIEKYNKNIDFLNKKNNKPHVDFTHITPSFVLKDIILRCRIKINLMDEINQSLRNLKDPSLQMFNLILNPFDFIRQDVQIITFEKAEYICTNYNLDIPFEVKCQKWSYDLIRETKSFYIDAYRFWHYFRRYCDNHKQVNSSFIDIVSQSVIDKEINGKLYKTTAYLYELEKEMTDTLMNTFYQQSYNISRTTIMTHIQKFEVHVKMQLGEEQIEAVIKSIQNKLYVITGFPGTGKTTIVQCILFIFDSLHADESINYYDSGDDDNISDISDAENDTILPYVKINKYPEKKNIAILAPTGLAYVGIRNKCCGITDTDVDKNGNYNQTISGTCHRSLFHTFKIIKEIQYAKKQPDQQILEKFKETYQELYNIVPQLIIVDEVSMIDSFIMDRLITACKHFNCRLIMLGDKNQLPSIGPGCNLKNMLESGIVQYSNLTVIKRQSGTLVKNIKKMTTTKIHMRDFVDDTMIFHNVDDYIDNMHINSHALDTLIDTFHLTQTNTKFLSYFKKETFVFNTVALNNLIQYRFNPYGEEIPYSSKFEQPFTLRVGDIIIRKENDYTDSEKIRANGEQAIIKWYSKSIKKIGIHYLEDDDGEEVIINVGDIYDDFVHAYALTVHKAQGSQYDNIIIFIDKNQTIWDKAALYTAISRAKKRCIIISKYMDFKNIQVNNKSIDSKVSLFMKESNIYEFE